MLLLVLINPHSLNVYFIILVIDSFLGKEFVFKKPKIVYETIRPKTYVGCFKAV